MSKRGKKFFGDLVKEENVRKRINEEERKARRQKEKEDKEFQTLLDEVLKEFEDVNSI